MLTFKYLSKIGKRPDTSKWKGVKDTCDHMHSIMNTNHNLRINVRDVVCLCTGCMHGDSACKYLEYVDNWHGFDMLNFKQIDADQTFWKSVHIRKCVGSREDYSWEVVRCILDACNSFEEALEYVNKNPLPFFD